MAGSVIVIPRSAWGARPWATTPVAIAPARRTHFLVHYDGGSPITRAGYAIPRAIDEQHHANGWSGVGYHHVVSQAGDAYEGRGWRLIGAHCEGFNTPSYGVQVAIGGDQVPTAAALRTVRALYDEACDRAGHRLVMSWHGAHCPTECAGPRLIAWVRAGMPTTAPARPAPVAIDQEDDVTPEQIEALAQRTAELVTGVGARHPVLVDEGTGAAELPGGRDIDALPTVVAEIQHEQRAQRALLERILTAVAQPAGPAA